MSKWTEGPWSVQRDGFIMSNDLDAGAFAKVYGAGDLEADANAHLIAAAPELYEALSYLVAETDPDIDEDYNPHAQPLRKARAALAKARGEIDG